jgi:hypothetical protein
MNCYGYFIVVFWLALGLFCRAITTSLAKMRVEEQQPSNPHRLRLISQTTIYAVVPTAVALT